MLLLMYLLTLLGLLEVTRTRSIAVTIGTKDMSKAVGLHYVAAFSTCSNSDRTSRLDPTIAMLFRTGGD